MSVLHRRQMGQLDAIQKCAHGELSRKAPRRYAFTLACETCEIETFPVRWSVEALRFLGGHVKHRTWVTATQSADVEIGKSSVTRWGRGERILDLLKAAGRGMTTDEIADDQDTDSETIRLRLLKLFKRGSVTLEPGGTWRAS